MNTDPGQLQLCCQVSHFSFPTVGPRARAPCWLPTALDLERPATRQLPARYTQGSYNSIVQYSISSNQNQLHFLKSEEGISKTSVPCAPTYHLLSSVLSQVIPPKIPSSYSAGALPGIDIQGSYNSITKYYTGV